MVEKGNLSVTHEMCLYFSRSGSEGWDMSYRLWSLSQVPVLVGKQLTKNLIHSTKNKEAIPAIHHTRAGLGLCMCVWVCVCLL